MNYIANVYGKIGDIFQVSGKQDGAQEYYKKSLNIFQEILKINPGSNSYKEGLVTTYNQLAELNQNQGNLIEAFNNYLAANELLSELNKTNPTDINIYTRWGISFYKISMILKAMNDNENGQQYFLLWKKMIEFLVGRYPDVSDFKQWNALTY
jgi:tetratricopeptide (TPR) repeat protein